MSETVEMYKAMKEEDKSQRAMMRERGMQFLIDADIKFETNNNGAHLIVEGPLGLIDFWPRTDKWLCQHDRVMRRGVKELVRWILGQRIEQQARRRVVG